MYSNVQAFLRKAKNYFNLFPDKEDEQQTIAEISNSISFRGARLWVLVFAIFIASLGLNVNSTAVIIGAMLISPLMGPIIGMGLAIGINNIDLLRRAARNFGVATLISILTATIYFLISPLGEAQSELLARTSPTLYDVLIAFFGGSAGFVATATKGKGQVIPGVAIATALMPPLCTAGYGIASGHLLYFLGAFYLFFINTVFICLATFLGVRMMRFKPIKNINASKRTQKIVSTVIVITLIPAVIITYHIIRNNVTENHIRKFIKNELAQSGTQILSNTLDKKNNTLQVVAIGKNITSQAVLSAKEHMHIYGLEQYDLNVIQGTQMDSLLVLQRQNTILESSKSIDEQAAIMHTLQQQLNSYTRYEELSVEICGELQVLFPQVQSIMLASVTKANTADAKTKKYPLALIGLNPGKSLSASEQQKLKAWLMQRINEKDLHIGFAPAE